MAIEEIIKDSGYKLSQFSPEKIAALEKRIDTRGGGGGKHYITCLIRKKEIKLTPEEVVRQLYLAVLLDDYGYPAERIELEYQVSFGREKKRADIVILDKDNPTAPYIIVELKKPKLKDGKEQLKSYCNATGAPIGVWTNGDQISFYHRKDPNFFEDLPQIPAIKSTRIFMMLTGIIKHDLFNTEGLTRDGIAEAFIEFAKKEKLSFF